VARRSVNSLEKWEVAIVKAMLARKFVPQDIQAYFSRPTRSINHARISEIRDETKHKGIKAATDNELDGFLHAWPNLDPPANISTAMDNFHNGLSDEEQADPQFRYRVAFVPKVSGKASKADLAIEFVKADSPEAKAVERVLLKEVERPKYTPSQIVKKVQQAGHPSFNMHDHTLLARQLDARNESKGYGVKVANAWYWYENWFEKAVERLNEGWRRTAG
jgi:hypothetical protein